MAIFDSGAFFGALGAGAIQTAGGLISAHQTNQANKEIAEKNLQYQRENLEYQKALQQKIFDREDSSYSRTVRDMRQAGLSALNMSGTNQAGQPIQTQALYNDLKNQPYDFSAFAQIVPTLLQSLSASEEIKRQRLENQMASDTYDERKAGVFAESLAKQISAMNDKERRIYNMKYGLNDSMSPDERKATIFMNLLGFKPTYWKDGNLSKNPKFDLFEEVHPATIQRKDLDNLLDQFSNFASESLSKVTEKAKSSIKDSAKKKVDNILETPRQRWQQMKEEWNSFWN